MVAAYRLFGWALLLAIGTGASRSHSWVAAAVFLLCAAVIEWRDVRRVLRAIVGALA